MTPAGDESVLYAFGASATDGYTPVGPLIQGKDGALYGTTSNGGANGAGVVFKITLNGTYNIIYSFGASVTDGIVPVGGLIQGGDGNFYGTTASGGANHCVNIPQEGGNCGTVFKLTPTGVETVIYSFGVSASDGVEPTGSLVQGSDGNLYGTTLNGGANSCSVSGGTHNCGTVFKITISGVETVLHSFGEGWSSGFLSQDGIAPQGSLIQGNDGAFYGTTVSGGRGGCGTYFGCGTVFRITSGGAITILYEFALKAPSDGYGPSQYLVQATDGSFYGTTGSGGSQGGDLNGTIFKITPTGEKITLYSFGPLNTAPSNPVGGLIQAKDGSFYGVTAYNGVLGAVGARFGQGAIFRMVPL